MPSFVVPYPVPYHLGNAGKVREKVNYNFACNIRKVGSKGNNGEF
jgi:hypothetical protein